MKQILYLGIFIILLNTSCQIQEIEIRKSDGVRFKNIRKNKLNFELMITVKNPNNFGFIISNIDINLSYRGKEIGSIKKSTQLRIPANSQNTYPIEIELNIDKTVGNLSSLTVSLLKNRIDLKAKGYVKVRKFIFTKKFPIDQNERIKIFNK